MSLTLGEKLQQAREARGITISEVAEQTRISSLYLEAIENNDYRTLPGGIFNKGFVKSYARYVGVDEHEALADYSRLLTEQQGEASDDLKVYKPQVLTDAHTRSSSITTIVFAVIILGLMTWGILALVNYLQETKNTPPANNSNTNPNANAPNSNVNPSVPAITAINEIKVELKAAPGAMSVTYWIDDKPASKNVTSAEPLIINPQNAEKVKISYYKGFTPDKVQLTINGKQITAPNPPLKGNVIFEITKENIAQILQNGQIPATEPVMATPPAATPQNIPRPTATPAVVKTPAANTGKGNGNR